MEALKKNPDVNRLVSHSLGSAVVKRIHEEQPNRFATTTYATPTIKPRRQGKQNPRKLDFRNPNDVVSMFDGFAETSNFKAWNPIIAHTYKNFEGQGMFHIRPTAHISNGINPNSPIQQKIFN